MTSKVQAGGLICGLVSLIYGDCLNGVPAAVSMSTRNCTAYSTSLKVVEFVKSI